MSLEKRGSGGFREKVQLPLRAPRGPDTWPRNSQGGSAEDTGGSGKPGQTLQTLGTVAQVPADHVARPRASSSCRPS